jgi:hypothetical protein
MVKKVRTNIAIRVKKPFLCIPYSLINSKDFNDLIPEATKIYLYLLSKWYNRADQVNKPIPLSYSHAVRICQCSNRTIVKALGQLESYGFIQSIKEYHRTNRFLIETKWFSGDYQ